MKLNYFDREAIRILREQLLQGVTINLKVSTDSMLPLIGPGDVIFVRDYPYSDLCRGEIILYQKEDQLFVHRLIVSSPLTLARFPEGGSHTIITKADMSLEPDKTIEKEEYIGKVVALKKKNRVINLDTRYWWRINRIVGYVSFLEYTVFRILYRWKLKPMGTRQCILNRYIKNLILLGFNIVYRLLTPKR